MAAAMASSGAGLFALFVRSSRSILRMAGTRKTTGHAPEILMPLTPDLPGDREFFIRR
jgi:hypothetical protein